MKNLYQQRTQRNTEESRITGVLKNVENRSEFGEFEVTKSAKEFSRE